ncbi:MAG: aspartate aminotransferase family protein [candidate division KSB1 bacterium]|nr:aspartate aminotransferase family protein [candidate division KSB1 bacterium]
MAHPLIRAAEEALVGTYARPDILFTRGEGSYLYDWDGRRYLDFVTGIAVNALGHCHPRVVEAIQRQSQQLIHLSNLYHSAPQAELAKRLVELSFAERVFFCNSGAEAVEGALKFARKWAKQKHNGRKFEIVAFENSFHGRTFAALTVTGRRKYRKGFAPMLPGVRHARFNDLDSAARQIREETAAVIVEPVQGEGGIHPARPDFLEGLRELCDRVGAVLIFDEIQCGMGRTGTLFAYEQLGVVPDIMVLAKPLGGGLPLGAVLVKEQVASAIGVGDHGSTFGGNPVACAAGLAVLDTISEPGFLEGVRRKGNLLREGLVELARSRPEAKEVRGLGLMLGLELRVEVKPLVAKCRERGLLLCSAGERVLRFLPPLTVTEQEIAHALEIVGSCLRN